MLSSAPLNHNASYWGMAVKHRGLEQKDLQLNPLTHGKHHNTFFLLSQLTQKS